MELETQKKQPQGGKAERQRQLNVIYFVDASKTHSFRVPLKTGMWLVGTLAVVVLWSFIGSIILLREAVVANSQGDRIQTLLDTVFQYQTRYDNVYEKAYPREGHERRAPAVAETKPVMAGDNPATRENEAEVALAAKAPKKAKETREQATSESDFPVEIAEIKATLKPNLLQVSFNMRNNRKPDLAAGTLWGVATYQAEGETTKRYVTAPMSIQLREDGETENFRGGYRFSIRYFNSRTLTFPTPSVPGSFTLLRIYIADEKSNEIYVTVPLQVSESLPVQSVAMPPHLKYQPPIRPAATASSADAMPRKAPKPSVAPATPKKNLTPPKQTTDNGGNSLEQTQEANDEDRTVVPTEDKREVPTAATPPPEPAQVIEEEHPVESMPTLIDDGPSE